MEIIKLTAIAAAASYNEMEVRFHIIDPIIRNLGYPDSDNVYLSLEEKLEYPYIHIGRRSKKDVPLGFPDYRAGLKGARGSFIVEAKAGGVPITRREVEQAHSYAAHAQVGANYFVLCNGSEIRVYETLSGPCAHSLATIPLSEIDNRFHELENILSPSNLARNCRVEYDKKLRLCEGLGSFARVRSGEYKISEYDYMIILNGENCTDTIRKQFPQIAVMDQQLEMLKTTFELRVADGAAERGEDGRIAACVKFAGATVHSTAAMQLMGIDTLSFVTVDQFLSRSPGNPTMFESIKDFSMSKGTMIPQFFGGIIQAQSDIQGEMFIKAAMFFNGTAVIGQYIALSYHDVKLPIGRNIRFELDFSGEFTFKIDI